MFIILLIIIAVAALNIVSILMMTVKDKEADIAILRALGMRPGSVMTIFIIQGTIIGMFGTSQQMCSQRKCSPTRYQLFRLRYLQPSILRGVLQRPCPQRPCVMSSSAEFSLQAIDLGKDYKEGSGEALHVLRNINFTLKAGETAAIIGSSGSGKSTLLNLLGGLDTPTSGQVLINDEELFTINEKSRCHVRNQHLGFIYQFHHLLPEFTALENVAVALFPNGRLAATGRWAATTADRSWPG